MPKASKSSETPPVCSLGVKSYPKLSRPIKREPKAATETSVDPESSDRRVILIKHRCHDRSKSNKIKMTELIDDGLMNISSMQFDGLTDAHFAAMFAAPSDEDDVGPSAPKMAVVSQCPPSEVIDPSIFDNMDRGLRVELIKKYKTLFPANIIKGYLNVCGVNNPSETVVSAFAIMSQMFMVDILMQIEKSHEARGSERARKGRNTIFITSDDTKEAFARRNKYS